MQDAKNEGDRRRAGLRALLARKGISPTTLAKQIRLPTANALFNFLNCYTNSLSLDLVERILTVHPDASFHALVGLEVDLDCSINVGTLDPRTLESVAVSVEADPSRWRKQFQLPSKEWSSFVPPGHVHDRAVDLFGVRVRSHGVNAFYPDGSLLLCRRLAEGDTNLEVERHYVVQYRNSRTLCVTVQKLSIWNDEPWLWPCSSNPRHWAPTIIAASVATMSSGHDKDVVSVKGLVIASWQSEQPLTES